MADILHAGLTQVEALKRLAVDGPNSIIRQPSKRPVRILLAQFAAPMIWLLLAAAFVSGLLGEVADAIAIGTIVVLNAIVGFFQEYRAEKALLALRAMTAPRARVWRDGHVVDIAASEVVVGDALVLEAGDIVAADAKLLECNALMTNEAPLTGESAAVKKTTAATAVAAPLAERFDSVFAGTAVASGTAVALVIACAMNTELGKIAGLLQTAQTGRTPLERRLADLSRLLLFACLGIVVIVSVLGLLRGIRWLDVLLTAVSLAVAAVPEGLPAIVTIALALGVQRMAKRHVLVRRLPAVETLGCATVICTDKTGTLTTGIMRVRETWGADKDDLFFSGAACCDAELGQAGVASTGDPTELAILVAAAERGILKQAIEAERPRVSTEPFSSEQRSMSITRSDGIRYIKGAAEVVVAGCALGADGALAQSTAMAERGLRVLAVAKTSGGEQVLVGLIGIADPPRKEAMAAIKQAKEAGIQTVMITGDHPATARTIARELGLLTDGQDASLVVHARATAQDKLGIVRAWKKRGAVVAMTGDGVNDAPALKEADIGIAMGKSGTEVTREAADIVLTDDNYASIIAAVQEGRGIYDNIRRALVYLLAGNAAELLVFLVAASLGMPLPLLPLHLLWINLVTDGLPALALVTEPVEPGALRRPPRPAQESILGRAQWLNIAWTGSLQAACTLSVFVWALRARDLAEARHLAFSTLVFGEVLRTFAARSEKLLLWEVGVLSNLRVLAVVSVSVIVQLALQYLPWIRDLFDLRLISIADTVVVFGVALLPVSALELSKLVARAVTKRRHVSI